MCIKKCMLLVSGVCGVLAVVTAVALVFAAQWLHVENKPQKNAVAIVLAGGFSRAFYAADLYRDGYVKKIYISRAHISSVDKEIEKLGIPRLRQEEIYRRILVKKGVPAAAIAIMGKGSLSTLEEAREARTLFRDKPGETLLVVTSPYHVRRAEFIFSRIMPKRKVIVLSTPYEPFPEKWWTNQNAARNVLLELFKIPFFLVGGEFLSQ